MLVCVVTVVVRVVEVGVWVVFVVEDFVVVDRVFVVEVPV